MVTAVLLVSALLLVTFCKNKTYTVKTALSYVVLTCQLSRSQTSGSPQSISIIALVFAAHIPSGSKKYYHISPIPEDLRWLPVQQQLYYHRAIMAFKCMTGCTSDSLFSKYVQRAIITKCMSGKFQHMIYYSGFPRKARVIKYIRFVLVAKSEAMVSGVPSVECGNWGRVCNDSFFYCVLALHEQLVYRMLSFVKKVFERLRIIFMPYTFILHTKKSIVFKTVRSMDYIACSLPTKYISCSFS